MLEIEFRPLEDQPVLWTSEPSLQSLTINVPVLRGSMCHNVHVEVKKQLYKVNSFHTPL